MDNGWLTYNKINQCKDMYANGATVKDISEALECTESDVLILLVTERVIKTIN